MSEAGISSDIGEVQASGSTRDEVLPPESLSPTGRLTSVGEGRVCTTSLLAAFFPIIFLLIASRPLSPFASQFSVLLAILSPFLCLPAIYGNALLFTMARHRIAKSDLPRTIRCMAKYARLGTLLSSASLLILTPGIVLALSLQRANHGNTPAQYALTLLGSTLAALCIVGSYPAALVIMAGLERRKPSRLA